MALQIGNVQEFDEGREEFHLYIERLNEFMVANDIDDRKKVSVLLSVIGAKTYRLLRSLLQPNLPSSQPFDVLIAVLKDHFRPPPITIAERYRFHKRNQMQGETVASYIVELKRLASTCDFGSFLDEAIRDRLVCGMNCEATQKRLLAKKGLTLTEASEIALAMELAEKNTSDIKLPTASIHAVLKQKNYQTSNDKVNERPMSNSQRKCFRCGGNHTADRCKYSSARCFKCQKNGHIAPVCRSAKTQNRDYAARLVKETEDDNPEHASQGECDSFSLYTVSHKHQKLPDYTMAVTIDGHQLHMVLDTAADTSTMGEVWLEQNLQSVKVSKSDIRLQDYNTKQIEIVGQVLLPVTYENQTENINFIIVKGDKPSLFGKDCIKAFRVDWHKIFLLKEVNWEMSQGSGSIQTLLEEYRGLFNASIEPIKEFKATINIEQCAKPVFRKARPVPYAIKPQVEAEIRKTQSQGMWKFTNYSKWATPLVIVSKKDGSVRLCGDFKVTINPFIKADQYPLPTQQDLFATLNGGMIFTKLDLKHAYQQVELDEISQDYLTLNTHIGLVRPTRLLYGITNAAAIFQSVMDQILHGLADVLCYQDDILITGRTEAIHIRNIKSVFQRLNQYGVKLNFEKCQFMQAKVVYLGHVIDHQGIHPTDEKIQAIKCIESPRNVTELRSFLGILNYYVKFIENASTLLHPLHALLHKDRAWQWTDECEKTFQKCKQILTSDTLLVHFDPKKKLKLSCDASPYGVGAIISHTMEDGGEKPIAYASRTLTGAEQGYSQIEREALAIIFGLKKYQQYLFGKSFVIVTDHKPLVTIFGPRTAVPALAAARIQRWSLLLSSFNYEIEYKKGANHLNVDTLSRLPMPGSKENEGDIFSVSYVDELPFSGEDIGKCTSSDPVLGRLLNYVKYGWPARVEEEFQPFYIRREQLSVDNNCVVWGMRVIIPKKQRVYILELLHDTHPGVCRMKAIARSHVWWPQLDREIEELSSNCQSCIQNQNMPPGSPLQSWAWPTSPWERIHIDFGQKGKGFFLIVVDGHSKWLEVESMKSITALKTIERLRNMFSRYGLPREVVSDNGPQLTSGEFEGFLAGNGIKHTLVPTYHPQSNGAAERAVQFFKRALDKMDDDLHDGSTLEHKIARFLLVQHSTPHTTTGRTPSELFMGRDLRTRWSLLHCDVGARVEEQQMKQKRAFDKAHSTIRTFAPGMVVLVRNFRNNPKWVSGTLIEQQGNKTWKTKIGNNIRLTHVDQIRCAGFVQDHLDMYQESGKMVDSGLTYQDTGSPMQSSVSKDSFQRADGESGGGPLRHDISERPEQCATMERQAATPKHDVSVEPEQCISADQEVETPRRYPYRIKKKPTRLDL